MRFRRDQPKNIRRGLRRLHYQNLEDRRLLAALVSFDAGTGQINIEFTDHNDTATVDVASGNVTVNGSEDVDTVAPGTQTMAFADVRIFSVNGDASKAFQQVTFNGNYSNGNGASLQSISVQNVNVATFNGNYQLAGDLSVRLVNVDGQIDDAATGQLFVGGKTTIDANNNEIILNNSANDFVGNISVINAGTGRDMILVDANDIQFESVLSSGDLIVNAGGGISDAPGTTIIAAADGRFEGTSVVLGDQLTDVTRFNRFNSVTTGGTTELNSDSTIILLEITAEDLIVRTTAGIYDGRTTTIDVAQTATFDGGARIRIGENGTDTFNAGSVSFSSSGHVHIWENSGIEMTGVNTASSLTLFADGSITDDATSSLNVTNSTGFEGTEIILGDTETDQFNTGSMYFNTPGDFVVNEDSGIHLIETKNAAQRLLLNSPSSITDADEARIIVAGLAEFTSNSTSIGDTGDDVFQAGSISFDTTLQFRIIEDDDTNIVGTNSANNAIIESVGNITDVFVGSGGEGTTIDVVSVAEFTGTSITLGVEPNNDVMNFGGLRVNSPGTATIAESSGTNFTFTSSVTELNLTSAGGVTDAAAASLNVAGVANIEGTSIVLGDTVTDTFNAISVTLNSTGRVLVTENSGLNLDQVSTADSMILVANGTLTDSSDADTRVTNLLSVSGSVINLGTTGTDILQFGSLTFASTLNTTINADSDVRLAGDNTAADQLFLTSAGNLTDEADAKTIVVNKAFLTGVDVIIGELADDCFDIINGDESDLFVAASGTSNVILGC